MMITPHTFRFLVYQHYMIELLGSQLSVKFSRVKTGYKLLYLPLITGY
jgi:hypothetical protein